MCQPSSICHKYPVGIIIWTGDKWVIMIKHASHCGSVYHDKVNCTAESKVCNKFKTIMQSGKKQ